MSDLDRIHYPLEVFVKYRYSNKNKEGPMKYYKDEYPMNHISCLQIPEISAFINSHMSKIHKTSNDENFCKDMQGLLNKLNKNNITETATKLRASNYSTWKHLYKMAESIILKCVNDTNYSNFYAELASKISDLTLKENNKNLTLLTCLVTVSQDMFDELMGGENKLQYEHSMDYKKIRFQNLTKCFGEMFSHGILNEKVIIECYNVLMLGILNGKDYFEPLQTLIMASKNKLNPDVKAKVTNDIKDLYKTTSTHKIRFNDKDYNFDFPTKKDKFFVQDILENL